MMSLRWRWVFLILFAAAPLLAATIFLQLWGPAGHPLSHDQLAALRGALSEQAFLPGAVTYAAITTIHLFACGGAIVFAGLILASVPRRLPLAMAGVALAFLVAMLMLAAATAEGDIAAYRLTYFAFEELYRGTGVGTALLAPGSGLTTLGLAVYVPAVLGVLAVALTAAAAAGLVGQVYDASDPDEKEQEALLCHAHGRIKRCAYVLSFVLVTSTVAAALFFQLPAKLALSDATLACCLDASGRVLDPATPGFDADTARRLATARARVEGFAAELTMFWGAIYTLTLLAAVGLPLLLVRRKVYDFLDALKPPGRAAAARQRMLEAGAVSGGGEQIKVLLAFVAPLVSAPVTSFLQAAVA